MKIVQTVFGVFHHFDLARQLLARGHDDTVFSTWPWQRLKREGLPRDSVHTFPWIHTPEYLMRRAGMLPRWLDDQMGYANALTFDEYTLRTIPECDALIAIAGSSLKTGQLVQRRGGVFICDRGSTHQRYQEEIVSAEFRRWGVDSPVSDPRDTAREEDIYDLADAITVPSTFSAKSFIQKGVNPEKIYTIPYGVRLENFAPGTPPPPGEFNVLFAGSVSLRKGFPYLLQAFAALGHPKKRLHVAGAVSREIGTILAGLPTENVEFLGSVPQRRLAELMSSSDVIVLPSIEEGLALVQGQALACGCPVIATPNTGAEDLFSDGVEGLLTPVADADALTQRLEHLAQDADLAKRMRVAALERVKSMGGWDTYGGKWDALLQLLVL